MGAYAAKITSKGQLTLPKGVRDKLGVGPGDEVEFVDIDGEFHLRKRVGLSPFDQYVGHLHHLEGQDPDALVTSMRDDD